MKKKKINNDSNEDVKEIKEEISLINEFIEKTIKNI